MEWTTPKKVLVGIFVGSLALEGLYYAVKWLKNLRNQIGTNESDSFSKLIFFPDSRPSCKFQYSNPGGCTNRNCRFSHEDTVSRIRSM